MWSRLRRWLQDVPIPDPIERRQALLVQVILLGLGGILLFAGLITLVAFPFTSGPSAAANLRNSINNGIAVLYVLVPLVLLRRGYFRPAVALLMIELFLFAFTTTYTMGPERGWIGALEFGLPISLAALALGRRWLLAIYLASVIGLAVTAFAWYPISGLPQNAPSATISFALIAGLLALFLDRFGTTFRESLGALRESEERYRLITENTIDAISLIDRAGRFAYTSPSYQKLLGYDPVQLLDSPVIDYLHPDDRRDWLAPEHPAQILMRWRHANGSWRWFNESWTPIVQGSASYHLVVGHDVTDRIAAEQALRAAHAELEQRVMERTAELTRSNQALEQASLTKDRFLASMSHELRTPLNAIIGFTGTLLMRLPGPLTPDQDKQLRTVQRSSQHLLALINDILDLAKIQSGNIEINCEPIVCQEVINEVTASLRPLAERKALELAVVVPLEPIVIQTDRRALSQIVINLVNNAIKFTDRGGVRVVLIQHKHQGQGFVEISVTDSGIGMNPEEQVRLFQLFAQVDNSHTRRQEGTGLGLHLSQKLAGLLGGQITVTSGAGQGSTFTVRLPEA
jgi:PAS domain S-box-containing protein